MKLPLLALALALAFTSISCQHQAAKQAPTLGEASLSFPGEEKHLRNIRQLTFGGQNAEAYFSADGQWLIFQSERGSYPCDEMYVMRIDGSDLRKISTGKGRTTCGYIGGQTPTELVYASTHDFGNDCPAKPDYSHGYVWPMYNSFEIYSRPFGDEGELRRLTKNNAYDAEATISPDQKQMVFTSDRSGDLDLYLMNMERCEARDQGFGLRRRRLLLPRRQEAHLPRLPPANGRRKENL